MKTIFSIIFSLFISAQIFAQDDHFGMSWDVTVPLGETSDYVGETSWLGFTMQWRKFMTDNVSVGISFGWSVLDQRSFETQSFKFTPDGGRVDVSINVKQIPTPGLSPASRRVRPSQEGEVISLSPYKGRSISSQLDKVDNIIPLPVVAERKSRFIGGGDKGVGATLRKSIPYKPELVVLAKKLQNTMTLGEVHFGERSKCTLRTRNPPPNPSQERKTYSYAKILSKNQPTVTD